jgi:hypothetical protein
MHPSEVALRETLAFVQQHLLSDSGRLLEVGCGSGEILSIPLQRIPLAGLAQNEQRELESIHH